jgi:hypothetical protein
VSTCDELLVTEIMFTGSLSDLTPEKVVCLMSALVFQEKADEETKMKTQLAATWNKMTDAAKRIAEVSLDAKLDVDVDDYVAQCKPEMMDVVYAWCKGSKFADICKVSLKHAHFFNHHLPCYSFVLLPYQVSLNPASLLFNHLLALHLLPSTHAMFLHYLALPYLAKHLRVIPSFLPSLHC